MTKWYFRFGSSTFVSTRALTHVLKEHRGNDKIDVWMVLKMKAFDEANGIIPPRSSDGLISGQLPPDWKQMDLEELERELDIEVLKREAAQ